MLQQAQSNKLISLFVKCPGIWLCFYMILCVILSFLAIRLEYLEVNDMGDRDFMQWKHKATKNYDMNNLFNDYRRE